jgi:hypothetical protein
MKETLDEPAIKTIEDLIRSQMVEKEALIRLMIKKGIITHEELREEVDILTRRMREQGK